MSPGWVIIGTMEQRACRKCGSMFDWVGWRAKGGHYICPSCYSAKLRRNRKKRGLVHEAEYQRKWRATHAERDGQNRKREHEKYPQKRWARRKLGAAVARGLIVKMPCELCGVPSTKEAPTHGHHEDYSKPYDVRWLCPLDHNAVHKGWKRLPEVAV